MTDPTSYAAGIEAAARDCFLTCESHGNPDPAKRLARVVMEFRGPNYLERAHRTHDWIAQAAAPPPPVPAQAESGEDVYLVTKRGLYYRPDDQGYTGIRDEAGRYTKAEAEARASMEGVGLVKLSEAPEFAPATWDDVARAYLVKQRDAAEARIRELEGENARLTQDVDRQGDKIDSQALTIRDITRAAETARDALEAVKFWASQKCPCENEKPNPCPLCGASVENLEACKAIQETLPPKVADRIDKALAALPREGGKDITGGVAG